MNMAQISSSLIFITTIAALIIEVQQLNISSIPNDNRLSLNVVPMHYDIQLNLMLKKYDSNIAQSSYIKQEYGSFSLHGESNITIQIHNSTQNIKFHMLNLAINQAAIKLTDKYGRIYTIKQSKYNCKTERFNIQFFEILPRGNYTLKVEFSGQITDNNAKSFVSSSYINREENLILLIAPHIQEDGARRLFPCWDKPHIKATFNISIKHHYEFMALSNMPLRDHYWDGDGLMWTHFHTTPPMSTYQVSIILSNFLYTRIQKHNINYCLWYAKRSRLQSLKYAMRVIEKITLHFESEFNDTKIPVIDHIVIPNYPYNADMSKLGLVFYREADLIYDYKSDPIMRRIEIARSVASKIACQWLGNVITPSWWSHFWLHEGLSILFGEEAVVKFFNNSQIMDFFIVQSQYDTLHLDSHFGINPPQINNLAQVDLIFNFPHNIKGIIVLRMLQDIFTDKLFRDGVHTILHKYKYRSLTFNKFWSVQEEITSLSYEYHLSYDFFKWIIYEHYPVISLTQEDPDLVHLSQYFNASQNSYGKWWIPISLVKKFSLKEPKKVWLTPEKPSLSVVHTAKDDWIMVDIRKAGYYRVKYDMENLRKIALYLNSGAYKNISVINRAKIIDDAFYFLLTREINATVFWELAKYLMQETDYAAWYPMLKMFEYISSVFPLSKGEIYFIHIKKTMREILTKPLKVLGFEKHPLEKHLITCLRQEIVKWACTVESSDCQMDNFKLEQLLENPALFKILPEWKQFIYCEGFKLIPRSDMGNDEYEEYNRICLKDNNATLQTFDNFWPKNLKLGKQHEVQQEDIRMRIGIFHLLIATHAKNDIMLKKILSFFHHIKPREINTTAALINIINHIYSVATLNRVTYSLKMEKLIDLGHIASEVYSKIKTRISEIGRHIEHLDMLFYTFDLKEKSDVKTSDAKIKKRPFRLSSDVKTSDVKTSDVKKPDVKIKKRPFRLSSDVKASDVKTSDVKEPEDR